MSQVEHSRNSRSVWPSDGLDGGIVDLYAQRLATGRAQRAADQQAALDRIVVTQPFGRAFTAQPSYPPDPSETEQESAGGIAGIRRKLANATTPARKLATS